MPEGAYLLPGGLVERFSCGPAGDGWRYAATRADARGRPRGALELLAGPDGRPVRLELDAGGGPLRGGAAGPDLLWRWGGHESSATAAAFTGTSPGLVLAVVRLLGLAVGERRRVALVRLGDLSPAPAALTVSQGWSRAPDAGPAARHEWADLDTGSRGVVHVVGDVLVDGPGVRLVDLRGAPTLTR